MFEGKMKTEREDKAEIRKINKPLMEKRRRARINACLSELKMLVLQAMRKEGVNYSKLEKADILELTVEYLKNVQKRNVLEAASRSPEVVTKYVAGYNECTNEAVRYLSSIDGVDNDMKTRLVTHLLTNARRRSSTAVNVIGGRPEMRGDEMDGMMMNPAVMAVAPSTGRSSCTGTPSERDLMNDIFVRMMSTGREQEKRSHSESSTRYNMLPNDVSFDPLPTTLGDGNRMNTSPKTMTSHARGAHHAMMSSQIPFITSHRGSVMDTSIETRADPSVLSEQSAVPNHGSPSTLIRAENNANLNLNIMAARSREGNKIPLTDTHTHHSPVPCSPEQVFSPKMSSPTNKNSHILAGTDNYRVTSYGADDNLTPTRELLNNRSNLANKGRNDQIRVRGGESRVVIPRVGSPAESVWRPF